MARAARYLHHLQEAVQPVAAAHGGVAAELRDRDLRAKTTGFDWKSPCEA
jgi:hypothetical protein